MAFYWQDLSLQSPGECGLMGLGTIKRDIKQDTILEYSCFPK